MKSANFRKISKKTSKLSLKITSKLPQNFKKNVQIFENFKKKIFSTKNCKINPKISSKFRKMFKVSGLKSDESEGCTSQKYFVLQFELTIMSYLYKLCNTKCRPDFYTYFYTKV